MVNHILRLKLSLLASAFRPGWALVRTMGVVLLVGWVAVAMIWLSTEVDVMLETHRAALVIVATCASIGIALVPLSAGLDSALEPRRFSSFPIEPRQLAIGLGVAGAIGIPGVLVVLLGIALERAWAGEPTAAAAVMGAVLGAISIVIVSKYLVVLGDQFSASKAARRTVTAIARLTIVAVLAVAIVTVLVVATDAVAEPLVVTAAVLGNTPIGMLWSAPISDGAPLVARLFAGLLMVIVLAVGWGVMVARLLESPQRTRVDVPRSSLGWFDLVPATPSGVIAARSIVYWMNDPRYRFVLLGLPLAPVVMMLAFAVAGAPLPPLWLLPLPVLALFLGWFSHNDVAYDHSAIWLHVAASFSGASDRWGRAVPPLLIGVPTILAVAPFFAAWSGVDMVLPALIGMSLGLLFTGLGVSSVTSAVGAYPAARPNAGPFDQPPSLEAHAGWSQALSLLAILAFMAPTFVLVWWGFSDSQWFAVAGIAGAATGVGMLLLGIVVGGRAFRRRAPELLNLMLRT